MAMSYSFVDNKLYGTDDINNITKNLVGGGIAPFPTKDSYSISDLNSLSSAVVESGVCRDGFKCSLSGNVVTIAEGVLYFENGVCLTVDEGGYEVEVMPSTAGYICAHFDDEKQEAEIIFCTQLPSIGFNVMLAEISAEGVISDKRVFARSKIGTLGTNSKVTFTSSAENNCRYSGDLSRFNYALLLGTTYGGSYIYFGVFDIKTGRMVFAIEATTGTWSKPHYEGYVGPDGMRTLSLEIIDGELYVSREGVTVILV